MVQTPAIQGSAVYSVMCIWLLWRFPGGRRLAVSLFLPFPPLPHHVCLSVCLSLVHPPPSIQSTYTYGSRTFPSDPAPSSVFPITAQLPEKASGAAVSWLHMLSSPPAELLPPPASETAFPPQQTSSMYPSCCRVYLRFRLLPAFPLPPSLAIENFLFVFLFTHVWLTFTEVQRLRCRV